MKILKTNSLTKIYGKQKVVDNLNIALEKGEIYGFLGRNGAGKTTTIRMMMGLIKPTNGDVEIFGKRIKGNEKEIYARVGSMIEHSGFYGNLTAKENLYINAKLMGVTNKDAIEDALEIVGLSDVGMKKVKKFSLGMKQRLGIARSILHKPEILILDEPTNGLDPVGIKEIRSLIKQLAEERDITIFVSSHILSEVEQLANRIGIIHKGQLIEEMDLKTLMENNRQYLQIQSSSSSETSRILETQLDIFDYEVIEDNILRVYEKINQAALINSKLVKENLEVFSLYISENSLEDYFIKITGGDING